MGAFSHWGNPKIGGIDDKTGKRWIMYDLIFGGYGGRSNKDGVEALAPVMNCANVPVEVHETNNPIRVHLLQAIPDTCGAGLYRGGCGTRKDVEVLCENATVVLLGDRHKSPPYGLFGGKPGSMAETLLIRDGKAEHLGSKEIKTLQRGDVISFRLAGAGGYGDPSKRSREQLKRDVADGYITAEKARELYGMSTEELS